MKNKAQIFCLCCLRSVSKQIYNLDFGARSGHSALSVENTVLEQLKGHKLGKQKHIRGEDCCDLSIQKSKRGGDWEDDHLSLCVNLRDIN